MVLLHSISLSELDNWRSVIWSPSPHQAVRVFQADHVYMSTHLLRHPDTCLTRVTCVSRVRGTCVALDLDPDCIWSHTRAVNQEMPSQCWPAPLALELCPSLHSLLSPHTKSELRLWLRFLTGQIYTCQGSGNTVLIPSWQKIVMPLMIPLSAGKIF